MQHEYKIDTNFIQKWKKSIQKFNPLGLKNKFNEKLREKENELEEESNKIKQNMKKTKLLKEDITEIK